MVLALSTAWLMVSPFEVTGWPWSGRVCSTPLPRVDCPVESVTPDSVWLLGGIDLRRDGRVLGRARPDRRSCCRRRPGCPAAGRAPEGARDGIRMDRSVEVWYCTAQTDTPRHRAVQCGASLSCAVLTLMYASVRRGRDGRLNCGGLALPRFESPSVLANPPVDRRAPGRSDRFTPGSRGPPAASRPGEHDPETEGDDDECGDGDEPLKRGMQTEHGTSSWVRRPPRSLAADGRPSPRGGRLPCDPRLAPPLERRCDTDASPGAAGRRPSLCEVRDDRYPP